MKIDTLVLAGASTKVPAYIGVFEALYETNLIQDDLQGITHIITCSIGLLVSLFILLRVNIQVQKEAVLRCNFLDMVDMEIVNINDLLFNLGLFDNSKIASLIKGVLTEKYSREDMTLLELYEINPIKLTVKCVNATKSCNAYINHETDPELSILTLLKMTTAIPMFFKPIEYKGELYVDGGVTGGYPIELVKDNYLGINIKCKHNFVNKESPLHLLPIIPYYMSLSSIKWVNHENLPKDKTIHIYTDVHFSEFDVSLDKKNELIQIGYETTMQHIQQYNLTNDNLPNEHLVDTDPTEED